MASRRRLLAAGLGTAVGAWVHPQGSAATTAPLAAPSNALPARTLVFPRDLGSHPEQRTEWWYITGHATSGSGTQKRSFGFQLTFFRARVDGTQAMASRFAARQLLFAHAAVTDVQGSRFYHDQRIARGGSGAASASEQYTDVRLRDWSLRQHGGLLVARVSAADFALQLDFSETQPLLLQGDAGLSRKGPDAAQASYYYSQPQLAFTGDIVLEGRRFAVQGDGARQAGVDASSGSGAAWMDHEWSDGLMHPDAVGWDWIGMNLFDGGALTAFQMRDKAAHALWDGGSFRRAGSDSGTTPRVFQRGDVLFQPIRSWKSPLTQAVYPVEWQVRTPADSYIVRAVLDNQELDSRHSTGAVYWEGLSELLDGQRRPVGRGYLEMTGYARPLVL